MKAIHPSLKDSAADYLREQILTGQLTPGTKIDQDEISARAGHQPPPVREHSSSSPTRDWSTRCRARGAFVASLEAGRHRRPLPRVRTGGGAGGEPGGDVAERCRPGRVARDPRVVHCRDRRRHPSELEPRVPPAHRPRWRLPPAAGVARLALLSRSLPVRYFEFGARVGRDISPPPRGSSLRSRQRDVTRRSG